MAPVITPPKTEVLVFHSGLKVYSLLWDFDKQGGQQGEYKTNLIIPATCSILFQVGNIIKQTDSAGGNINFVMKNSINNYNDLFGLASTYAPITDDKQGANLVKANGEPVIFEIKGDDAIRGKVLLSVICLDYNPI